MPYSGNHTGVDLRDLGWFENANRGQLSRGAACFGLELAQLAYDFEAGPWLAAGWTDLVIQVDQRLLSGVRSMDEVGNFRQQIMNLVLPKLAKSLSLVSSPINEIRSYFQKTTAQETGKAIVLIRPDGDGRFTVAVGFMGTGRRPQDWAGNMRFGHEDHFHEGFSMIAAQFEENAPEIHFPAAAKALGLEDLTLKDVLEACKKPGSPFRLVVAGHSQGAAVLQVWAYRRLMDGFLPENLVGFGFASPQAAVDLPRDEVRCPLTHFLVSEDLFIRMGLRDHLGTCWRLEADEAFREKCYGKNRDNPLFLQTLALFEQLKDTPSALLFCLAYLEALSQRPHKAIGTSLAVFVESSLAEMLPVLAEEWTRRVMRLTMRSFAKFYTDAAGAPADPLELSAVRDQLAELMDLYGAVAFSQMLFKTLHQTHALVNADNGLGEMAPYAYLVNVAFDRLQRVPEPPEKLESAGVQTLPEAGDSVAGASLPSSLSAKRP